MKRIKKTPLPLTFKAAVFVLTLIIAVMLFFVCFGRGIRPTMLAIALPEAKNICTQIANDTVTKLIEEADIKIDKIVSLERDGDGNVIAVTTDMQSVNLLKSRLSSSLASQMKGYGSFEIVMPFGTLSGSEFFSGRGPDITLRAIPSGSIESDLSSVFEEAGINQTIHRILLDIDISFSLILPLYSEKVNVATTLVLAETVIIGDVPEAYTSITRLGESKETVSESDIDDIYDFGAVLPDSISPE